MCLADEGIINAVQSLGSLLLDNLFVGITQLGNIMFYIVLISLIYWCFNKKAGFKLFCLILFLGYSSIFLKNVFKTPRPDKSLWRTEASGYGFPSGHVTVTAGFWSYILIFLRKKWLTIIGFIIIFFIAFSRVYLGVHFLLDIIGGLLIGVAVALCFYYLETRIRINLKFYQKTMLAVFIPLIMIAVSMNDITIKLCSMLFGLSIGYLLDEKTFSEKSKKSFRVDPTEKALPFPRNVWNAKRSIVATEFQQEFLAFSEKPKAFPENRKLYFPYKNRTVNIQTSTKNKTRVSRAVIGLLLVSAVFLSLSILPSYLDFIQFIILGLTITFFAPVVFSKTDKLFK